LSGLKANLGSFFGAAAAEPATAAGAADVEGAAGDGLCDGGDGLADCEVDAVSGMVIELAEGVSFRGGGGGAGGAGGGWNVSGRFVSLSPEAGACDPKTIDGLVCSAVDTE
jgi:hypothetical protein